MKDLACRVVKGLSPGRGGCVARRTVFRKVYGRKTIFLTPNRNSRNRKTSGQRIYRSAGRPSWFRWWSTHWTFLIVWTEDCHSRFPWNKNINQIDSDSFFVPTLVGKRRTNHARRHICRCLKMLKKLSANMASWAWVVGRLWKKKP